MINLAGDHDTRRINRRRYNLAGLMFWGWRRRNGEFPKSMRDLTPIRLRMDTQTICDAKVLLILTAIKTEYVAVKQVIDRWMADTPSAVRTDQYDQVAVEIIGIRAKRIREVIPVYSHSRVAGVIMAGLAGALSPELDTGDVIIDSSSTNASSLAQFMDNMSGRKRVFVGPIHTSRHIVSSPAEKKKLYAESQALAVEMENSYAYEFALKRQIPWLAIRAISDTAFESVPAEVMKFVDSAGNVKPWDITRGLARHPGLIPSVVRLGKHTQVATRKLSDALAAVIRSGWPSNI